MIARRVTELKQTIKVDTQKTRANALKNLEELFDLAVALAKGQVKTQTVEGQKVKVTLKQRQIWARVAAYIAQIMNSIATGFDERQINADLEELECLVNEARAKTKNEKTQKGNASERGNATSSGPS